jgi:lysophospholipase L1-like esterase
MTTQTAVSHTGTLSNVGRNSGRFSARPSLTDVNTGSINITLAGIFTGASVSLTVSTDNGQSWTDTGMIYKVAGSYKLINVPITNLYRLQLTAINQGVVTYNAACANPLDAVTTESGFDPVARTLASRGGLLTSGARLGTDTVYFGMLGDSRTANSYDVSNYPYCWYEGQGIPAWMSYLSNNAVFMPPQLMFGVGGYTTADVLNYLVDPCLTACLQNNASFLLILAGTNDRTGGLTMQQSIDNMSMILTKCLTAGIWPVLIAELPRGDAANTSKRLTSPQLDYHFGYRDWMRYKVPTLFPGTTVIDCWPTTALYTSTTGDAISGLYIDGLHPNLLGARTIAQCITPLIAQRFATPGLLPSSATGLYSADNPRGWINSNPVMTGSTTSGVNTGYTGNTATGWVCTRNSTAAAAGGTNSVAVSKINRSNSSLIQLTFANIITTGTAGAEWVVYQDILANCTPGDLIEAVGAVEIDAGAVGICRASISVQFNNLSVTEGLALDRRDATSPMPNDINLVGVQRTPQVIVPVGLTVARLRFSLILAESTTCSGTLRFGPIGAKKVL